MNEAILMQLKILVERAVRPVRASVLRKRKMREELLAHVSGVFEEEAKLGDEQAALARTQERFGQAAELTGQLQASVPRGDDIHRFAENLVGYGSGESALRLAAQAAAAVGAVSSILLVIAILVQSLRGQGSEWLTVARVPSLLAPLWGAFLAFCGALLYHGMRQALFGPAGRSWLRAGLIAAAAWLLIPATTFALCLAVTADLQGSLWDVVPLLPHGVLVPVVMVAVACVLGSECRHDREWTSLQID
jgi:ATP-dependent Clp protease ATP-binding subunit ClpC